MFDYGVVRSLTVALSKGLESVFDNPCIYQDMLPMGYKSPCFFVNHVDTQVQLKLFNRYRVVANYDITYHPEERKFNSKEFSEVVEKMTYGLELVQLEDVNYVRGSNIRYEVQEGVLHFFMTFDFFVIRAKDRGTKMEKLYQRYGLKEV